MDVLAAMCEMTSKQQRDGDGETSEETEMYVVLNPFLRILPLLSKLWVLPYRQWYQFLHRLCFLLFFE